MGGRPEQLAPAMRRKPADRDSVFAMLGGGDRRSIGRAREAAALAQGNADVFGFLIEGLAHEDPIVRMRCADAAEKASASAAAFLQSHAETILATAAGARDKEIRWHIAQMLPRLKLTKTQRGRALAILQDYFEDRSRIVAANALQALVALSASDPALAARIRQLVERCAVDGPPSLRARAQKLLR